MNDQRKRSWFTKCKKRPIQGIEYSLVPSLFKLSIHEVERGIADGEIAVLAEGRDGELLLDVATVRRYANLVAWRKRVRG